MLVFSKRTQEELTEIFSGKSGNKTEISRQ